MTLDAADKIRISADSHMSEPIDLFEKNLPERFKEYAIHIRHLYGSGFYARRGGYEPGERLKDMARDGIVAEVLYPTFAKDMYHEDRPPEAAEACASVYNDWMIEFCQEGSDRLWGQAEICLWDVDRAIKEMERTRRAGLVGATIWMVPPSGIPFSSDHYDRFWAASQDLAMPISMHINTGFGRYDARERGTNATLNRISNLKRTAMGHKQVTADTLTDIICSGVCERYPGLKVIVAEIEIGWIPFWLEEMDKRTRRWDFPLKPSEYFYRQCYSTFTEDPVGGRLLEWYGQDSFMWSTDYPHVGTGDIWLYSDEVIEKTLAHLKPEVRAKVLRENVAKLYGKAIPSPLPEPEPDPSIEEWRNSRTLAGV
jgi:predicted TIM-barrel fold metal-dependent hydrolase